MWTEPLPVAERFVFSVLSGMDAAEGSELIARTDWAVYQPVEFQRFLSQLETVVQLALCRARKLARLNLRFTGLLNWPA